MLKRRHILLNPFWLSLHSHGGPARVELSWTTRYSQNKDTPAYRRQGWKTWRGLHQTFWSFTMSSTSRAYILA